METLKNKIFDTTKGVPNEQLKEVLDATKAELAQVKIERDDARKEALKLKMFLEKIKQYVLQLASK